MRSVLRFLIDHEVGGRGLFLLSMVAVAAMFVAYELLLSSDSIGRRLLLAAVGALAGLFFWFAGKMVIQIAQWLDSRLS